MMMPPTRGFGGSTRFRLYSPCRRYITRKVSRQGWLWVDSVFPVQLGRWDFRKYIGFLREEHLLDVLRSRLEKVQSHNFQVLSVEPQHKDGGAFVKFSYVPEPTRRGSDDKSLEHLDKNIKEEVSKQGGVPSWLNIARGSPWVVKGSPWREDMDRYATPNLRLSFNGPDIAEQPLWEMLRPYGRIKSMDLQNPISAGTLRSAVVQFSRLHEATVARNVVHDLNFPATGTRLKAGYDRPNLQAHSIGKWLTSHPRIVFPVLVLILGALTYTIFDPLRSLMIQAKVTNWFSIEDYEVYKWIRSSRVSSRWETSQNFSEIFWKDRKDAKQAIEKYLEELPTSVTFLHGPQGSGKSKLIDPILGDSDRNYMVIDCRPLLKASTDAQVLAIFAGQIGYWPFFTFLNSVSHLMDLASIGLTGQKSGFSTSTTEQVQSILDVAESALKNLSWSHRKQIAVQARKDVFNAVQEQRSETQREGIISGTWHDGRMDCVTGNGLKSEVGIGGERFDERDADVVVDPNSEAKNVGPSEVDLIMEKVGRVRRSDSTLTSKDPEMTSTLPIVVLKNFASNAGNKREELLDLFAQWSAYLVENHIAHVIVLSDNRENSKRLAKAFPIKPLNYIALFDADSFTTLAYLKQKLEMKNHDFTSQEISYIDRIGGRARDLESLINKLRSGSSVKEAVEDIISRGVAELRKNAFGDDLEDAKSLPWTREQAWRILKLLSANDELPYTDILLDFPFKGDESALRSMESIDMIAVGTHNGRPSTIRPGKPIFRYVFQRLVNDPIFKASQDIAYNEKLISGAEATITKCEDQLLTLKELGAEASWFDRSSATSIRARRLNRKLYDAERRVQTLEKQNSDLKKILRRGG